MDEAELGVVADCGRRSAAAASAGAMEFRPVLPKCLGSTFSCGFEGDLLRGVAAPDRGVPLGLTSLGLSDSDGPT